MKMATIKRKQVIFDLIKEVFGKLSSLLWEKQTGLCHVYAVQTPKGRWVVKLIYSH